LYYSTVMCSTVVGSFLKAKGSVVLFSVSIFY
jgi:hypothetical protein